MTWSPGETVVVQEVWRDRVWSARPMTVVHDHGAAVALWFPKGTCWKAPTTPPTRKREATRGERFAASLALADWTYVDAVWDFSALMLMREADWHSVRVAWLDDGEHWGWYVNLEEPYRRTAHGFETMDLMLDVIIDPDRSWRWKDEEELQEAVEAGLFTPQQAKAIRHEGERVLERVEAWTEPFNEGWEEWRPDSSWPMPSVPEGWDRLSP